MSHFLIFLLNNKIIEGFGANRLGCRGEMSRHQIWAKRLRAKRLGANWSWGETTCYPPIKASTMDKLTRLSCVYKKK